MEKYGYRFSFGPWNIHERADPFGPAVRPSWTFDNKLTAYKELGYDAVQFHDDDAVPDLATKHLRNSLDLFLRLVGLVRSLDRQMISELIAARDYEELDWLILNHLLRDS